MAHPGTASKRSSGAATDLTRLLFRVVVGALLLLSAVVLPALAQGPPYPEPIDGVRVYDNAGVLSSSTSASVGTTIRRIEERTGAQVVVYTQIKPQANTEEATERDALALVNQWGIGRAGFDDGMVVFLNFTNDLCHGQVQLYAAPGFASTYLSNAQRQAIFDDEMMPRLRACDIDGAVIVAIDRIDEHANAENAARLKQARQINAVLALVVAPLLLIGVLAWAGLSWLRGGRDPKLLDDESILMAAPPRGLSPAAAAVIMQGRAKRRALTAALVDLASRGEIAFRQSSRSDKKVNIDILTPDADDPSLARNRRDVLGPAERYALGELKWMSHSGTITADDVPKFGESVSEFDKHLEETVTDQGWFHEAPRTAITRWSRRSGVVMIAGGAAAAAGLFLTISGLLAVGVAALVAGGVMLVVARAMPRRTPEGARMNAQLSAYRRTLEATLAQARSMDQVTEGGALPWLETPDRAIVWTFALGLEEQAELVLKRSLNDVRGDASGGTHAYFPLWYTTGARSETGSGMGVAGSGMGVAGAGLFSAGALPDFTAMTAALGTIGNSPSSDGGGGGFGGGGGGGGGAGGGF